MTNSEKKAPQPKTNLRVITPVGAKIGTSHKFINGSGFTVSGFSNRIFKRKKNREIYEYSGIDIFAQINDETAVFIGFVQDRGGIWDRYASYLDGTHENGRTCEKHAIHDLLTQSYDSNTGLFLEVNGEVKTIRLSNEEAQERRESEFNELLKFWAKKYDEMSAAQDKLYNDYSKMRDDSFNEYTLKNYKKTISNEY